MKTGQSAKTYILSIAISKYDALSELPNAENDSDTILNLLESKYKIEKSIRLHGRYVTLESISNAFNILEKNIDNGADDEILIFYNGHGCDKNEEPYWALPTSKEQDIDTWYSFYKVVEKIKALKKAKHIIVFSNSCYSGSIAFHKYFAAPEQEENTTFKSRKIIAAGRGKVSDSFKNTKNSPFAYFLRDVLEKNNNIESFRLDKVISRVKDHLQREECSLIVEGPLLGDERGDFHFHLKDSDAAFWNSNDHTAIFYREYLQRFPSGVRVQEAKDEIHRIEKEEESILKNLKNAKDIIRYFLDNNENISANLFLYEKEIAAIFQGINKDINTLKEKIDTKLLSLTKEKEIDTNWAHLDIDNIKALHEFEKKFGENRYSGVIKDKIEILENREKQKDFWDNNVLSTRKAHTRMSKCSEYLNRFEGTRECIYKKEAEIQKYTAKIYIDAIEETDEKIKISKLEKFIENFDVPLLSFLKKQAEEELAKIKNEEKDFFDTLYEKALKGDIECCLNFLKKYRTEFHDKSNDIIQKMHNESNAYFLKIQELIENINPDIFIEMCMNFLDNFDNQYFKANFIYLNKVEGWLKEIIEYIRLSAKQEYLEYNEKYGHLALMRNESNEKIKLIEKIELERELCRKINSEECTLAICEEYLKNFSNKDTCFEKALLQKKIQEVKENSRNIFMSINLAYIEERYRDCITLCDIYLSEHLDGEYWIEVNHKKNEVDVIIQDKIKQQEAEALENKRKTLEDKANKVWEEALYFYEKKDWIEARNKLLEYLYECNNISLLNKEDAENLLKEINKIIDEYACYEDAKEKNTEEGYLKYLKIYGSDGIFYLQASMLLRNKQLGMTEEMLSLDKKIENSSQESTERIVSAISQLNNNFAVANDKNNQTQRELIENISKQNLDFFDKKNDTLGEQLQKMNESFNKKLLWIIPLLFTSIIGIGGIILYLFLFS